MTFTLTQNHISFPCRQPRVLHNICHLSSFYLVIWRHLTTTYLPLANNNNNKRHPPCLKSRPWSISSCRPSHTNNMENWCNYKRLRKEFLEKYLSCQFFVIFENKRIFPVFMKLPPYYTHIITNHIPKKITDIKAEEELHQKRIKNMARHKGYI